MGACTQRLVQTGEFWLIEGRDTIAGGGETSSWIVAEVLGPCIIDGVSLSYHGGAGGASDGQLYITRPKVVSVPVHIGIGSFTAAASKEGTALGASLGMYMELDQRLPFLTIFGTLEATSLVYLAAWGRQLHPSIEPSQQPPLPVSLEGYKWPLVRR